MKNADLLAIGLNTDQIREVHKCYWKDVKAAVERDRLRRGNSEVLEAICKLLPLLDEKNLQETLMAVSGRYRYQTRINNEKATKGSQISSPLQKEEKSHDEQ